MKRSGLFLVPFVVLVFLASATASFGQTPKPSPPPPPEDTDVVKITTKLVQVDLLVVDRDGKQVTDLKASDFELLQDGKPQRITDFSYVNTEQRSAARVEQTITDKNAPAAPPVRLRTGDFGRVITFIVDDGNCAASIVGIGSAKAGIEKFIREQMLSNDVVAIYQTRSGSSVFQQYTNDKAQLLKATAKLRWNPPSGSCGSGDGSFYDAAKANTYNKTGPDGTSTTITIESADEKSSREAREDSIRNNQVVGSLGVIRYVVDGLQRIPGRKVLFFLSDGLPYRSRAGSTLSGADAMRDLTDLANRSSVVLNTIDARGLFDPSMIEARDEVLTKDDMMASSKIVASREKDVRDSQDGLAFLADETGGTFTRNVNNLDSPIKQDLDLEKGYYLLAYEPSDETFRSKKFNKIKARVSRPGLRVISRSGFMGIPDQTAKVKKRTGDSELYEAIVAPLPRPGLAVRLSAFFANAAPGGNFVRSLFHLDGNEITFVDDANGMKKVVLDVVAVTLNEKNAVADEFTRTHTLKFDAATVQRIKANGLIYSADVPVKTPGTYTFRVAVRDEGSKLIGTASQVIQVPDLKRPSLYLSGLTVTGVDAKGKFEIPRASTPETAISLPPSTAVPAIREFRRGSIVAYAYTIYNAVLARGDGRPKLEIRMNLYKDGKLILEGPAQSADLQDQSDWARIADFAYLRLNPQTEPGDYALQIIIRDLLAPPKQSTSSQWVDFEVIH